MSKLKPCPFPSCGSSNVEAQGVDSFAVACLDCGANGPIVGLTGRTLTEDIEEAERLWNERPGDELVRSVEFSSNAMSVYVKKGDQYYEYTLADFYGGKGNEDE